MERTMMQKRAPLSDLRRSCLRWREGRKLKWFFAERFSARLLASVDILMREMQFASALYLMLLGVEILSGFYEGAQPDRETFCAFISRYMDGVLSLRAPNPLHRRGVAGGSRDGKGRLTFAEFLWALFRCGFADVCAAYPGGSIAEHSRYYCRYYSRVGLRLEIHKFYKDFVRAYHRYYSDAVSDYLVRQKFVRRFDQLCGGR